MTTEIGEKEEEWEQAEAVVVEAEVVETQTKSANYKKTSHRIDLCIIDCTD